MELANSIQLTLTFLSNSLSGIFEKYFTNNSDILLNKFRIKKLHLVSGFKLSKFVFI